MHKSLVIYLRGFLRRAIMYFHMYDGGLWKVSGVGGWGVGGWGHFLEETRSNS